MDRLGRRCSCGARRRPVRRLAQRGVHAMLAGFSLVGLSQIAATAEHLTAVSRWNEAFAVQAPCCTRTLADSGTSRATR